MELLARYHFMYTQTIINSPPHPPPPTPHHINRVSIGSDNGMSPIRGQAII